MIPGQSLGRMQSLVSTRVCPLCILSAASRGSRSAGSSWLLNQRFYTPARGRQGSRSGRSAGPSRMVLSHDVGRSPAARAGRGRDSDDKPRRKFEGPFGGMNVTSFEERNGPSRVSSSRGRGTSSGRDGKVDRRTKAMKMQGMLSQLSYGHRSRIKEAMGAIESFDALQLLPTMKTAIAEVLKGMVDIKPTPVQRLTMPALLGQDFPMGRRSRKTEGRQEFLLAAETGSGKTLAYLAPVINALKEAEAADSDIVKYREYFDNQREAMRQPGYTGPRDFDPHPTMARPRVVVLVPTAELVDQVGAVAKSFSHVAKFKTIMLSANVSASVIHKSMYNPAGVDLVVSTPHILESMAESDPNILSRVSHLVIDEADSLFDRGFTPITTKILERALPAIKQLILCSATIPKKLDNYIATQFPDMVRITTPNLHAIPRRVQLGVIDVTRDPYRDNKDLACADAIWSIGKDSMRHEGPVAGELDVKRIMVFVNERQTTERLAEYLVSKGIDAMPLNRDASDKRHSEILDSFTTKEPLKIDAQQVPAAVPGKRSLANTKVIVATDLASRGIDTLGVRHVILYDVPHTTIDFIHRLGRAGRMGRRGRGVVLVGRYDRKDIVAEVRESMYLGQALI